MTLFVLSAKTFLVSLLNSIYYFMRLTATFQIVFQNHKILVNYLDKVHIKSFYNKSYTVCYLKSNTIKMYIIFLNISHNKASRTKTFFLNLHWTSGTFSLCVCVIKTHTYFLLCTGQLNKWDLIFRNHNIIFFLLVNYKKIFSKS